MTGTTATITNVGDDGLTITLENGAIALLGADFVRGTRKDGSPNLSHAWARTVDGAQGGTWEACHLLGSGALDAYRGYTGQSRSRQPTHTWNTTRVAVVDSGGILADRRDGAEHVADALARQPDPSLAARSDPWTVDSELRRQYRRARAGAGGAAARPPGGAGAAVADADRAQAWLANMDATAGHTARQLEELGRLAGSPARSRPAPTPGKQAGRRHRTGRYSRNSYQHVARAGRPARRDQDAFERFQAAEGWRRRAHPVVGPT